MIDLFHGDCLNVMRGLEDNSVDSIVTDPPYGLSFMGKHWDYDVPGVDVWKECLRVLKPGGHLLSFGGSRTYHRMAVNIEDAGFEIRDQIMWVYGCLSDDTEILTKKGWEQYRIFTKNSIFVEEEILIYDTEADIYKWEKPERWNEYTVNEDTAYRIQSDNTDQIVSRGHRCLVEREGKLVFVQADELNGVECVPTLPSDFSFIPQGHEQILQSSMQRTDKGRGMGVSWVEGEFIGNTGKEKSIGFKGRKESCVEGGSYLLQTEGEICEPINQVCEVSGRICSNGEERRVCNGTQVDCCVADREGTNEVGVCSSPKSQRRGQPIGEFNAFPFKCGTQAVGTRTTYKASLATVIPIKYSGVIFCPTVSTGAFVARRNGKVFITGNSGFPKSLNIGKAVDKLPKARVTEFSKILRLKREELKLTISEADELITSGSTMYSFFEGRKVNGDFVIYPPNKKYYEKIVSYFGITGWDDIVENNLQTIGEEDGSFGYQRDGERWEQSRIIKVSTTKEAKEFEGWGTALKPAHEPIVLARKPISEKSIAENCLKWGTGGLNIDGCRVNGQKRSPEFKNPNSKGQWGNVEQQKDWDNNKGRFPANFIHDGSQMVLDLFPESKSTGGRIGNKNGAYNGIGDSGITTEYTKGDPGFGDSGSAARYFYCAKASKADRDEGLEELPDMLKLTQMRSANGTGDKNFDGGFTDTIRKNHHPTVKPTTLMQYLCRLVTPKNGTVLDPFMGSGSTGKAAVREGFSFIGIEREAEYVEIAKKRIV